EPGNPAQPLFVVAKLEVLERLHAFGAGPQRGPGPVAFERGGQRVHRVPGQRVDQVRALGHHRGVNAEDAFLPFLHEDLFLEIDRAQVFQAAELRARLAGEGIAQAFRGITEHSTGDQRSGGDQRRIGQAGRGHGFSTHGGGPDGGGKPPDDRRQDAQQRHLRGLHHQRAAGAH
nr:hypothetical protein [Tanacetum cinerariifolium]